MKMMMMKLREQASKNPVWMCYICTGERVTSVIPVQAASSVLDLDDVK